MVIGILIAVQINNWNVKLQNTKKEILYLTRMTTNLGYDKRVYDSIIKEDSILINKLNEVKVDIPNFLKDIKEPSEDLNFLTAGYKIMPNKTTIENLVSSGQIELLRSNYLVEDIFLYYRQTEYVEKGIEESIYKFNKEEFSHLIFEYNPSRYQDSKYINTFSNAVNFKITLIQKQIDWYKSQKSFAERLINQINEEIRFIKD